MNARNTAEALAYARRRADAAYANAVADHGDENRAADAFDAAYDAALAFFPYVKPAYVLS